MNTIKIDKKNTLVIAHRGLSGIEPENSIPAFVAAGNRSYYGIETDIHVTKDGKFIIIHDDSTARVAEADVNVEQCSYNFLRKLTLNNLGRNEILSGVTQEDVIVRPDLMLPNLEEYVSICKKYDKKCILELKNTFPQEYAKKVIEELKRLKYLENTVLISFSWKNMMYLRELLPKQELQYLTSKYNAEVLERLDAYDLELDVCHTELTKEVIEQVHAHGHTVNAWTVDDASRAEELISWGIDYITTNILE